MIGVNKNIKQDTLTISDWDVNTPGYNNNTTTYPKGQAFSWYSGVVTQTGAAMAALNNVGQGGWTFASLSDSEYNNMLVSNTSISLPAGSFPFLNFILVPVIATDAGGNVTLTFNKNSICNVKGADSSVNSFDSLITLLKSTATANNGKLKVSETTVPAEKNKITHLLYVTGKDGNKTTGSMTIDPTKFAAFTVGTMGSGAEIILTDTTIAPGKEFLFGDTQDTSFSITFTTALNVVQ